MSLKHGQGLRAKRREISQIEIGSGPAGFPAMLDIVGRDDPRRIGEAASVQHQRQRGGVGGDQPGIGLLPSDLDQHQQQSRRHQAHPDEGREPQISQRVGGHIQIEPPVTIVVRECATR